MRLISPLAFLWFNLIMLGIGCVVWLVVDIIRLRQALRETPRTKISSDRIFGSVIGICMCLVGLSGLWLYLEHQDPCRGKDATCQAPCKSDVDCSLATPSCDIDVGICRR